MLHAGGVQGLGAGGDLRLPGAEPGGVPDGLGGVEQHGVDLPGMQGGQGVVGSARGKAAGVLLAPIGLEQRGGVGRGEIGHDLLAAAQCLVQGGVVALHLGEHLGDPPGAGAPRRNCTARTSPLTTTTRSGRVSTRRVTASATSRALDSQRFSARCWNRRCDQPPGGGTGHVQLFAHDLGVHVRQIGQDADQLRAEPVGDHHQVRQERLGDGEQRRQVRQRADAVRCRSRAARAGGRCRGAHRDRPGDQGLPGGVGVLDECVDRGERGGRSTVGGRRARSDFQRRSTRSAGWGSEDSVVRYTDTTGPGPVNTAAGTASTGIGRRETVDELMSVSFGVID